MTLNTNGYKNIGDYGLIGDRHSAALVGIDGSIDWCAFPRFDSPSVFAAILDGGKGGRFAITPSEVYTGGQRYLQDSNVLETRFVTRTGACTLTDFMPFFRRPDRSWVAHGCIIRILRCTSGSIPMRIAYEPRPDYARSAEKLYERNGTLVIKDEDYELILESNYGDDPQHRFPLEINESGDGAYADILLTQGQELVFVVRHVLEGHDEAIPSSLASSMPKELQDLTDSYWRNLSMSVNFSGQYRDIVVRSYLVLHLLVYVPTGAIVAAPTTSLPEWIGGSRNWDYRFTWLRDAAFTVDALMHLGHTEEAVEFFEWLAQACGLSDDRLEWEEHGEDEHLHILYRIDGETDPTEEELPHLEGYKASGPVRIGNGAYDQIQQDVYGELLASAHLLATHGEEVTAGHWDVVKTLANLAAQEWREPDSGIWEVRGGPFQFVTSNALCWVALDRAIKLGEMYVPDDPDIPRWRAEAEAIKEEVLIRGWSDEKQAFVQHYDSLAMDAGLLLLPLMGFIDFNDPRFLSTLERIEMELRDGPFVNRYRTDETDDGVFGPEGAFTLCSFWLVQVLNHVGRRAEAQRMFNELLTYANHLGLFAEMIDPRSGLALGNFPQAFTHIGLILAALECSWHEDDSDDAAHRPHHDHSLHADHDHHGD